MKLRSKRYIIAGSGVLCALVLGVSLLLSHPATPAAAVAPPKAPILTNAQRWAFMDGFWSSGDFEILIYKGVAKYTKVIYTANCQVHVGDTLFYGFTGSLTYPTAQSFHCGAHGPQKLLFDYTGKDLIMYQVNTVVAWTRECAFNAMQKTCSADSAGNVCLGAASANKSVPGYVQATFTVNCANIRTGRPVNVSSITIHGFAWHYESPPAIQRSYLPCKNTSTCTRSELIPYIQGRWETNTTATVMLGSEVVPIEPGGQYNDL